MKTSVSPPCCRLDLTESRWYIYAGDAGASPVVSTLAEVMSLPYPCFREINSGAGQYHQLHVFTDSESYRRATTLCSSEPGLCLVPPPSDSNNLAAGMVHIARVILHTELSGGAVLIHGALAETPKNLGGGVLLAGPGNIGKTTTSNRLPLSWRSLSDDAALVTIDGKERYWAHPWPTWSRFFSASACNPGPGGSWNVAQGIPLKAVFFLSQAEEDKIEPVSFTPALTYLMETMQQLSHPITRDLPLDQVIAFQKKQLAAAERLVRTIPAFMLHLTLTGTFWKSIEEELATNPPCPSMKPGPAPGNPDWPEQKKKTRQSSLSDETMLTVSYSGPSMNPTLRHHDLLEVVPYGGRPILRGDVVYFRSPQDSLKVIHRVVRVSADGIFTRGDNNCNNDPYTLSPGDIIGRVAAAWRHKKRRKISGGILGVWCRYKAALRCRTNNSLSPHLHGAYRAFAAGGLIRSLLPASFRPRVIEFRQRYKPSILKLMVNGHVVGRYDGWRKLWEIDRPWRLIVDETKLPVAAELPPGETPDPINTDMQNTAVGN